MLTGYNTDFKYQGKVYHCQTEDGGVNNPNITSLLYQQGAILASRKTSYSDILKADCLDEVVRELMMEQHKQMIRDLMQGKLDAQNAPHEATYTPASAAIPTPEPEPEPEPTPAPAPKIEKPIVQAAPKPVPKASPPPPPPPPPPPSPPVKEEPVKAAPIMKEAPKVELQEEVREKSLDDIILEFLAQEERERKQKK